MPDELIDDMNDQQKLRQLKEREQTGAAHLRPLIADARIL